MFTARRLATICSLLDVQVWRSVDFEEYDAFVLGKQTVRRIAFSSLASGLASFDDVCRSPQVVSAGSLGVCSPEPIRLDFQVSTTLTRLLD